MCSAGSGSGPEAAFRLDQITFSCQDSFRFLRRTRNPTPSDENGQRPFLAASAQRLLLEKIGTYLETRTAVKNFQIASDEIVALTAGIVKTEILDEEWNGETYRLTARIEVDPDDIAEKIDDSRRQRT